MEQNLTNYLQDVKTEKIKRNGWAIIGRYGLYVGWDFTRRDMIKAHCSALGKEWNECRRDGDRCIKVRITNGWYAKKYTPKKR